LKVQNRQHRLDTDRLQQKSKVKKFHQIGNCRYSSGEAMFNVMQNMIMDNEFQQIREIIENRNESVVAHNGMIAYFEAG
jgi:wobble nucleotide-excising tRNase